MTAYGMELPAVVADLKSAFRSGRGVVAAKGAAQPTLRRLTAGDRTNDTGARFVKP